MVRHISKCFVAGIIAILPIAGTLLVISSLESMISSGGIAELPFYFPGMGLLLTGVVIYLLGLITTTLIGRWVWNRMDALIKKMPTVGTLYGSLKQILGYGEGEEAVFQEVVILKSNVENAEEIGLVTNRVKNEAGEEKLVVFLPGSPNPTTGRMVVLGPEYVKPSALSVHEALKSLVTIGKVNPPLSIKASVQSNVKSNPDGSR